MTYPWPTLMPMGIVVISCVRPSVQPSMGLGLCIAYKALGRNGLQFGMLVYPDGLHSAFMDAYGYCCWSVCPSICPFVRLRHFQVAVHLLTNHLEQMSACPTIWVFFFFCFFLLFFSKVRVGAKEGGSHYWEMAVAITCGYGGYLLPLLAAHSSYWIVFASEIMITCDYPASHWQHKLYKNVNMIRKNIANFPSELLMPSRLR